jgi:hypothetical protein
MSHLGFDQFDDSDDYGDGENDNDSEEREVTQVSHPLFFLSQLSP